MSNQSG